LILILTQPKKEFQQMALSHEDNDDALCSMHEDIRGAHDFTVAIARLTETLDPVDGVVFQRLAQSALEHIDGIERQVDELRLANCCAEVAAERHSESLALAGSGGMPAPRKRSAAK
jgi:hypothetical protein